MMGRFCGSNLLSVHTCPSHPKCPYNSWNPQAHANFKYIHQAVIAVFKTLSIPDSSQSAVKAGQVVDAVAEIFDTETSAFQRIFYFLEQIFAVHTQNNLMSVWPTKFVS